MASTKIQNLPLKAPIGAMKIPTGGFGDYSITVSSIGDFIIDTFNLATKDYVDNLLIEKEDRIDTTGGFLTPVSQNSSVPDTTNDVIDEVAQALLDRIEYVKDNFSAAPSHNELTGRSATGAHPSTSISHKSGTVYTYLQQNESDLNNLNNVVIPEINNSLATKQELIETGGALTPSPTQSTVPSLSHTGLNSAIQALLNRTEWVKNNNNVKSVNSKIGDVVLTPSDIATVGDNNLDATVSLTDVPELIDKNGVKDTNANAQAQALLNNIFWFDSNKMDTVESISELVSYQPKKDGTIVNLISYHEGLNRGGDLFIWRNDLSKSLHDGGYIIDPLISFPSLATFNTYYAPQNTGTGVWVRLNNKSDVYAEAYGIVKISDDPSAVWSCAAIQQAILKASVRSSTDYASKSARVMSGRYYTTNPIVLTQIDTFSARLPALIGGNGGSIYEVELIKTTENTVGVGYAGGDKDAVIYVSSGSTAGKSMYVYGENTRGFTLSRTTPNIGYGYFSYRSVMGYRGEIQSIGHAYNIYTDDCWMSSLGFLRSYQGLRGISIRGGTSNYGGPLYVDGAKEHGYDFYSLTYSNLLCACDGVGSSLADGGIAYDFSFARGVSGTFAVERHKGTEFYLHYTDGCSVSGRSFDTTPVTTAANKITVNGGSTFTFNEYNWKETFANAEMTAAEIAKYKLTNKPMFNGTSSINFENCILNDNFASSGYVAQLDSKFAGNVIDSAYINHAGLVVHTIALSNASFKRLCYVGASASIELISANCISTGYGDRYYSNALTLTEGTPNMIANPKQNRIAKSAISTNSAAPTNLWNLFQSGAISAASLQGYIDPQGWLCVRPSVSGNNLDYRFVIAT